MADPAKTCDSGQFCQLDVGVCNAKNGVFNGACAIKPEVCIQIYDPVRELELTSRHKTACYALKYLLSVRVVQRHSCVESGLRL
jgi:hypothetical protein